MLYLTGTIISVFLVFILVGKRKKTIADKFLLAWLMVCAVHLLLYYLYITGKIYEYPSLLGINMSLPLFHGPLLFLYTCSLTGKNPLTSKLHLLHALPIVLINIPLISFFMLPPDQKIAIFKSQGKGYETFNVIHLAVIMISGTMYVLASLLLLRKYRKAIQEEFSTTEKINLMWLRYLIYGVGVIWILVIFGKDPIIFSGVVLFVILLGYFGIRQAGIFSDVPYASITLPSIDHHQTDSVTKSIEEFAADKSISKSKYERSGLTTAMAENIYAGLNRSMIDEKSFKDLDLTLTLLAKRLNVHPNHLSQVINTYEQKNFYDYINWLRVEEFKNLVLRPENQQYTLLSLAHECGFNSKTTFNRNFKKVTGLSPSEYLSQAEITLS